MAFGKRHLVASTGNEATRPAGPAAGPIQPSALHAELIAGLQRRLDPEVRDGEGIVPSSSVAFLAASLAVMVVHMVVLLTGKNRFAAETVEILQTIGVVYGRDPRSFATLALFASIWSGGRAAAAFTLPAHLILRALGIRSVFAYAVGAAAASAIWLTIRGFSGFIEIASEAGFHLPSHIDGTSACASGLVAGATYRIVAGSRGRRRFA
jgi:hypothetical protein